ncbi:hypothetical protein RI129_011206 [Pyrocoelia pectoralis]|uniref:Integrin-alpha FG-GAP repeat-containing protein 2 n=1 Tax=Pyrocoelia pectoralis TaxID=417401 RepID=A0AAN7V0K6_9COLE
MRSISLVDRLEFDFSGNVLKKGLTLGDVDNDGVCELVVGGETGNVAVFKGMKKYAMLTGLSFVSCLCVGDVLNVGKNCLVVITADGWCHIYSVVVSCATIDVDVQDEGADQVDGQMFSSESIESERSHSNESAVNSSQDNERVELKRLHLQRIPANTKDVLLADIDGDGLLELVVGLTDRVVRSYRWVTDQNKTTDGFDNVSGKLVCLNKWECAKQIGSITLHHSPEGVPSLLVAQPGGTFMRIICQLEDVSRSLETTGEHSDSGSSRTESLVGSRIDYQFLGISRARNQNISTEIVGDLIKKKSSECTKKGRPYSVATLDGTIMLVHDDIITWSIAVDHQIFSLHKMDVTEDGCDNIIACSWDGQTYILDQDKNLVKFQLEESVQAFDCGYYNIRGNVNTTCFVYVTFHNKVSSLITPKQFIIICHRFTFTTIYL